MTINLSVEKVKVSDLIAETLEELGITHIFGIIGAGNVHLFEAISKRGFTEIICVHHEQAACMAIQTYYRSCGKLSAALLTTGAGSTNGVTGVVSAWADSIPCVVIAGNENSKHTNPDGKYRMWGVQGYDSVDMVRKVTKYSKRVYLPEQAIYEIKKGFHIALDQRPGPCWIEIPMDIQSSYIDSSRTTKFSAPPAINYLSENLENQIIKVVKRLREAERPLLWLGHGIRLSGATEKIKDLIDIIEVPAIVSWAGIDMIDSNHPLLFGRAGVYGQRAANFILQNCDYLITIGTRLSIPQVGYDLTELARVAEIDVVDIDFEEATKHKGRIRESIVCDASIFIDLLINQSEIKNFPVKKSWIHQCINYQKQFPWVDKEHDDQSGYMNSYRFMERLNKFFKEDQFVVTDMGTALLCGHQILKFKEGQRLMTSTGLGEMGYGLPAAIGASFARNRGEIMCLNCDGGMMLNLQELQTIAHHRLPIKLFIFNNDGYLMIKHTQNALFNTGYVGTNKASGVSCPDFSKLAKAFNIPSFKITTWKECDSTITKVQNTVGPVICEVFMNPEQLFSPKLSMVSKSDGSLVSPPLEDLSPLIPRKLLEQQMLIGIHEKSRTIM